MPDHASRKRLRKKVLDRWENEGGMILEEQPKTPDGGLPDERDGDVSPAAENAATEKGKTAAGRNTNQSKSHK